MGPLLKGRGLLLLAAVSVVIALSGIYLLHRYPPVPCGCSPRGVILPMQHEDEV